MGKINKGFTLGALLGAGLLWLTNSKKGKKLQEQIKQQAVQIKTEIEEKLEDIDFVQDFDKEAYLEIVQEKVDQYIVDNPFLQQGKDMLVEALGQEWESMKKIVDKKTKKKVKQVKKTVKTKKKAVKKVVKKTIKNKKKVVKSAAKKVPKKVKKVVSKTAKKVKK